MCRRGILEFSAMTVVPTPLNVPRRVFIVAWTTGCRFVLYTVWKLMSEMVSSAIVGVEYTLYNAHFGFGE